MLNSPVSGCAVCFVGDYAGRRVGIMFCSGRDGGRHDTNKTKQQPSRIRLHSDKDKATSSFQSRRGTELLGEAVGAPEKGKRIARCKIEARHSGGKRQRKERS